MGRFERSDRHPGVDVQAALRRAREEVARNRGETPPPDTRDDDERELDGVQDAMRRHDERSEGDG